MNLKLFLKTIFSFALFLIINSCNKSMLISTQVDNTNTLTPTTITTSNECISSFEVFAYTVKDDGNFTILEPIPPLSPWEVELEFPKDDFTYRVINSLEINGDTEIWIMRKKLIIPEPGNVGIEFVVYSQKTKKQFFISAEIGDTGVYVDNLFINSKGELWGSNKWLPNGEYSLEYVPILSKYNEVNQRFEFDYNSFEVPLIQDDINFHDWADIFLDDNDMFWFFIQYNGLYTYLPNKGEMDKKVNIPEFTVWQSLLAPNGNIYYKILDDNLEEGIKIHQYSPLTNETTIYTTLKDSWPKDGDIFMDSVNRLWFGATGFLTEDGNWYLLQTNVDEYFQNRKEQHSFLWDTPDITIESSNGYIWFDKYREIDNGMAWYDPQTGEGCWFTTYLSNIIEDKEGILWMIADGKLYKYDLYS